MTIKQEDSSSEKGCNSSDEVSESESPYPRLKLNAEEKRLLQKEGITLPSHYPLTKHEERELKRIRRKIRNKISAQDSRKRKKEYVDGLEDRVKQCTEENTTLLKRIKALQSQNQSLAGQLKRLQALLQKGNKSAQPATCLMVLLLSLALVAVPNLRPHSKSSNELVQEQEQPEKMPPLAGQSNVPSYSLLLAEENQPFHVFPSLFRCFPGRSIRSRAFLARNHFRVKRHTESRQKLEPVDRHDLAGTFSNRYISGYAS